MFTFNTFAVSYRLVQHCSPRQANVVVVDDVVDGDDVLVVDVVVLVEDVLLIVDVVVVVFIALQAGTSAI